MFSCKVIVILNRIQSNFNFLGSFSKNTQISNFMKICPVGAELFHADGGTFIDEASNTFLKCYERAVGWDSSSV
jgi:hypothetical protein